MGLLMRFDATPRALEMYEDRLVLIGVTHFSVLGKGGNKVLYLNQITGVQFKKATTFGPGWLHFVVPGDFDMLPGVQGAAGNENTVLFQKKDNALAEQIKSEIETRVGNAVRAASPTAHNSGADEIRKYRALLDQGVITEAEFEQQKKKILSL